MKETTILIGYSGVVITGFFIFLWLFLHNRRAEKRKKKLYQRFNRAHELLKKWQQARPLLKPGGCLYAKALVLSMIATYQELVTLGLKEGPERLAYLECLLAQTPPPSTPPKSRRVFIEICARCARIVKLSTK